ncbi:Zn-ribbon domain-containing OB-fold protein [Haloplanus halophilus]|uniref:Zn-ribbon domain-containing OB-fold protein n=1 Tax=Haloplanus halophilus TaxID=2949993 RepID=UPI00203FA4C2|nr:Zn-ribbon domain-containing OB-fold protein [Haloplanus sp. GDY1]
MTDAGYDEWLDAVDDGEGYYLRCPEGHGSLPPRRVCPHCGSTDLGRESLPTTGTVETYTVCYVGGPDFEDEEPYATAIADFGDVRLTGVVRGVDPEDVAVGTVVEPTVGTNRTTGDDLLVLRAR